MRKYRCLNLFLMMGFLNMLPVDDINNTENLINQKIEETQKNQEKDWTTYWHTTIRFIKAPVDYVFGQESSRTKTVFYVVVGAIVVVVGAYGSYRYIYEKALREMRNKESEELFARIEEQKAISKIESEEKRKKIEAQQKEREAQIKIESDLKLYRTIVADCMNVQADRDAIKRRLDELEKKWSENKDKYSRLYSNLSGGIPYYQAQEALHKERAELMSQFKDLGKRRFELTQQEIQFRRDHEYISLEQFKEVENLARGVFNRWGRSIIA